MKTKNNFKTKIFFAVLLTLIYGGANAQITTVISGGSTAAGTYGTFASAISALNGSTITGAVTVDATAGQT